jgi:hypothetical protein
MNLLPLGMSLTPPASPWGINFGGGLNSTAVIIECRNRGLRPDWILFADTGSEMPGTLDHVERMRQWCDGWCELTVVRWIRKEPVPIHPGVSVRPDDVDATATSDDGDVVVFSRFEPLHAQCLRSGYLPSKAYGNAGCTSKWKIQPMEKWRKERGFDHGAFAVGYDAGEISRITKACQRGDDPGMTAWYPLVAWGIDRLGCEAICSKQGITVGKSSCFMCPNLRAHEWEGLRIEHPDLFDIAMQIEDRAREAGNISASVSWPMLRDREFYRKNQTTIFDVQEDRCHHGGCFT